MFMPHTIMTKGVARLVQADRLAIAQVDGSPRGDHAVECTNGGWRKPTAGPTKRPTLTI